MQAVVANGLADRLARGTTLPDLVWGYDSFQTLLRQTLRAAAAEVTRRHEVLRTGFDRAHTEAKTQATQARGAWKAITGETYGGLKALTDVTLEVEAGQFVAVVGPNGAGKSSLLRAIAGLHKPAEGRVLGFAPGEVALLPQQAMLDRAFPLTCRDAVLFGLWGESGAFRATPRPERIETALRLVTWPARLQPIDRGPLFALLPEGSRLYCSEAHRRLGPAPPPPG